MRCVSSCVTVYRSERSSGGSLVDVVDQSFDPHEFVAIWVVYVSSKRALATKKRCRPRLMLVKSQSMPLSLPLDWKQCDCAGGMSSVGPFMARSRCTGTWTCRPGRISNRRREACWCPFKSATHGTPCAHCRMLRKTLLVSEQIQLPCFGDLLIEDICMYLLGIYAIHMYLAMASALAKY